MFAKITPHYLLVRTNQGKLIRFGLNCFPISRSHPGSQIFYEYTRILRILVNNMLNVFSRCTYECMSVRAYIPMMNKPFVPLNLDASDKAVAN